MLRLDALHNTHSVCLHIHFKTFSVCVCVCARMIVLKHVCHAGEGVVIVFTTRVHAFQWLSHNKVSCYNTKCNRIAITLQAIYANSSWIKYSPPPSIYKPGVCKVIYLSHAMIHYRAVFVCICACVIRASSLWLQLNGMCVVYEYILQCMNYQNDKSMLLMTTMTTTMSKYIMKINHLFTHSSAKLLH